MNRKLFIALTLLFVVMGIDAQIIDQRLARLVEHAATTRATSAQKKAPGNIAVFYDADGNIKALSAIATLKSGAECPTEKLEELGIKVRFTLGNMVAMEVPANKLMALQKVEEISYVSADEINQNTNKKARKTTGVDLVNTTEAAVENGLPDAFTGEGVVLGVIDGGIDFQHAAFCNPDGTTRIKKAIICGEKDLEEYTGDEIATMTADSRDSHGTHTAATAGGSDTGNGQKGVAPKADLILCGLGTSFYNSYIIDCMKRIFAYADQVGKSAVISISLGSVIGLHDGSDSMSQAIEELTEKGTRPGRVVLVSTGNAADNCQSIIKKLDNETDQLKTVLGAIGFNSKNQAKYKTVRYCFYADDYKDFKISLKVVNIATGELMSVGTHLRNEFNETATIELEKSVVQTAKGGLATIYYLDYVDFLHMDEENLRLALVVEPGSAGQTIKMVSNNNNSEEPCFDAPNKGFDFVAAGYTKGNADLACDVASCNDAVISVGSFVTRTRWTNWQGQSYAYSPSTFAGKEPEEGEISFFSSYCIDDNGIARPTLIAPGQGLISASCNYDTRFFLKKEPGVPDEEKGLEVLIGSVDLNGRKSWYHLDQGTSMSCPHAAGIVTLWMQAKPTLTVNEIREVMKETCFNDKYTTDPSMIISGNTTQAGYGKIDCLEGLKKILGVTSIEELKAYDWKQSAPAQLNYVDAPVYDVKGQQVPNTHKGMVIYKGRKYVNK